MTARVHTLGHTLDTSSGSACVAARVLFRDLTGCGAALLWYARTCCSWTRVCKSAAVWRLSTCACLHDHRDELQAEVDAVRGEVQAEVDVVASVFVEKRPKDNVGLVGACAKPQARQAREAA